MTPGQFIDLLAEAGMLHEGSPGVFEWKPTIEKAEKFAKIVAAAEREECAKVCDEHWRNSGNAMECADAIRGRGEE